MQVHVSICCDTNSGFSRDLTKPGSIQQYYNRLIVKLKTDLLNNKMFEMSEDVICSLTYFIFAFR